MNKNTETAVTVPAAFDFATRDVAAKAEAGADLEVLDPVTGEASASPSRLPVPIPPFTARLQPRSPSAA